MEERKDYLLLCIALYYSLLLSSVLFLKYYFSYMIHFSSLCVSLHRVFNNGTGFTTLPVSFLVLSWMFEIRQMRRQDMLNNAKAIHYSGTYERTIARFESKRQEKEKQGARYPETKRERESEYSDRLETA